MSRTLTFLLTGLCATPLLALAGFALTSLMAGSTSGGSDQTIARGYLGLLGGAAVAIVGAVVVGYLAQRYVPAQSWRYLLAADLLLVVLGLTAWRLILADDRKLEYTDATPVLQVELRIEEAILAGAEIDSVAAIDFAGGTNLSIPHPEGVRREGTTVILPWETTPIRVRNWHVRVFLRQQQILFDLPLPKVPGNTPDWSEWLKPTAGEDYVTPEGVSLRYRFLLRRYGS